jgi:hypothetical protein
VNVENATLDRDRIRFLYFRFGRWRMADDDRHACGRLRSS